MAFFVRLMRQKFNPPAPTTESFAGKTVLITGTSGGLGLETVKKLATLNVDRLIITTRSDIKGEATKKEIQSFLQQHATNNKIKTQPSNVEIFPMNLNMSSLEGVKTFVDSLKSKISHIDAVILNAGVVESNHQISSDGYENTLQVNTISTMLLAVLILPILLSTAKNTSTNKDKPHLFMVSSGTAWAINKDSPIGPFMTNPKPLKALSEVQNFPEGMMGGGAQYARSKLLLEYGMRHLSSLPSLYDQTNNQPKVIVGTLCPGFCQSDLARNFDLGFVMRIFQWIIMSLIARTAELGSNTYVSALKRDTTSHGQMWKDDKIYPVSDMITSTEGKRFGDNVWNELVGIISKADPNTKSILGAR